MSVAGGIVRALRRVSRRLVRGAVPVGLGLLAFSPTPGMAAGACQLGRLATIPITMVDNQPLMEGSVNGQPVHWLLDTGSFYSFLSRPAAQRLGLSLSGPIEGVTFQGVGGGNVVPTTTVVDDLRVGGWHRDDTRMLVVSDHEVGGPDVAGLIGMNMLETFDVELDFPDNQVVLFKPTGCDDRAWLAYWDKDAVEVPMESRPNRDGDIQVDVQVNGITARAILDTGSNTTVMTLSAARRAGRQPGDPGVDTTHAVVGIAGRGVKNYAARFDSFSIGDETIKNPRISFAEMFGWAPKGYVGEHKPREVEMLLGADFLRSHRVLISQSQGRLYLSYVGHAAAVFDVPPPLPPAGPAPEATGAATGGG